MPTCEQLISWATDNRLRCSECGSIIKTGEPYFRRSQQKWRSSHTVNLCKTCITKIFILAKITDTELKQERVNVILPEGQNS